jgi:hypothetical protein
MTLFGAWGNVGIRDTASDNDANCDNVLAYPTVQCGDRSKCSRGLRGLLWSEHALVLPTRYLVLKEHNSLLTPRTALGRIYYTHFLVSSAHVSKEPKTIHTKCIFGKSYEYKDKLTCFVWVCSNCTALTARVG